MLLILGESNMKSENQNKAIEQNYNMEIISKKQKNIIYLLIWGICTIIPCCITITPALLLISWITAAFISFFFSYYLSVKQAQLNKKVYNEYISNTLDNFKNDSFVPYKIVKDFDSEFAIVIDIQSKKVLLILATTREANLYNFTDIISCKLCQDEKIIISIDHKNLISNENISNIINSNQSIDTNKFIKKLYISITVNEKSCNNSKINLINKNISKKSQKYKKEINLSEEIISLFSLVFENRKRNHSTSKVVDKNNINIIDLDSGIEKIEKLYKLKEQGIISEDEFQKKKNQLLEL